MAVYRDEGIVLRTSDLGEADRIITLFTRQHGIVRAVAKGVRKTTSKFGARLEPFMVADMQLYQGRSLDIITQAVTLHSFAKEISQDYVRYTAASVMVETASRLVSTEAATQQYLLVLGGLRALAAGERETRLITDSYLLRAFSIAGWAPNLASCAVTGEPGPHRSFSPQLGGMVADRVAPPGSVKLEAETVELLIALLTGDWDVAEASSAFSRNQAGGAIAAFTQYHLERGLRSLNQLSKAARHD